MSGIVAGIVVQVLEAAAGLLGNAIKDVLSKSKEFKPRLKQLKSTVDRMTPIFKDIERLNQEDHRPETESKVLADQLLEGESLVLKCAGVRWWNKSSYTKKLIDYDRSLTRFFQIDVTAQILHSVRRVEKNLAGKKEKKKEEEEKKPDKKMKDAPPGVPRPKAEVDYGAVEDPIALLRNSPQFQALRPLLQKNPRLLELTLQGLREKHPYIFGRNKEHEAAFRKLIDEPVDGSDGHLSDETEQEMPPAFNVSRAEQEMPHTISVILAEQEAIERLEEMGFGSDLVIEAFLACDGNEELAVNYLLENAGYFED